MAVASLRRPHVDAVPAGTRRFVTAGLVVLMTAATGAAVLAAGWTDGQNVALVIGVLGALSAAGVTLLRPAPIASIVLAPVLLVACVVLPTIGDAPLPLHAGAGDVAGTYARAMFTGLGGNAQWAFNVGLGTLLWACGAWAMEMALGARRGALATAPSWTVIAVNVINSPSPASASFFSLCAAACALLVIAAVNLERLDTTWSRRGVVMLPGTTSRFAVSVAGSAVLVLLVASVVPALTSTDISGTFFGGPGSIPGGSHSGSAGSGVAVSYSRSTIPGGPLVEAHTPELTYTSTDPAGSYLAMTTDSVLAGGAWLPYDDSVGSNVADVVNQPGPLALDRDPADGGIGADTTEITAQVHVTNDASGNSSIPFPGEPDAASIAAEVTGVPAPDPAKGIVSIDSASGVDSLTGTWISASGTKSTASVAQLRAAGTAYPQFISDGGFLQLPDDKSGGLPSLVSLAQQWTAGATNPYDRATAIETNLRDPTKFSYTLNPQLPPGGSSIWPVVYFLTTTHAGYCQYFASAMGAMLRAVGIPSRLVNGYGPGNAVGASPIAVNGGGSVPIRAVTSDDAHTWVEAYFPTYGWIPFEPTPSSPNGDYEPFTRGGTTTPTAAPASASAKPHSTRGFTGDSHSGGSTTGTAGTAVAIRPLEIGGGALVLLALAVVAWALLPRDVPGVWRRMAFVARLAGVRRDPASTFRERAAELALALGAPASPSAVRLGDLALDIGAGSDRLTYGREGPRRDDVAALVHTWRALARRLPAAAVTRLRRRHVP